MKHIKTFEQFVNESSVDEIASRFKPKKPDWPFFFQIFAREADKDGDREKHKVTVGKKDDFREIEKQVLKDYPHNKYYYTLWKNVRGGFKNVGTNESEELTEEFLNELNEGADMDKYFIVNNGFTFTTIDDKKFTVPRKAEIEVMGFDSKNKTTFFKITKGKLDGHGPMDKEFEVTIKDFNDYEKSGDIELNESVNEAKTEGGEEGKVIIEKEFKIDGELVYTIVGLCVKRKTGFTGYINLVKRGIRPAGTSGFAPFASDYENVINIWKSKKPKDEKECESELKSVIKSIKIS